MIILVWVFDHSRKAPGTLRLQNWFVSNFLHWICRSVDFNMTFIPPCRMVIISYLLIIAYTEFILPVPEIKLCNIAPPFFCISSLSYWLTTGLFYCYIIMGNSFCCVITLLALKMSSFLKFILHKVKTILLFFLHLFIVCFKFVILENLTLNAISLVWLMLTVALVCFYLHFVFFSLGLLHADFTLAASSWIFIFLSSLCFEIYVFLLAYK